MEDDKQESERTSISRASSDDAIGSFWDDHDLVDFKAQVRDVTREIEVSIESESHLIALDPEVMASALESARERGVSLETWINLTVRDATKRPLRR